MNHLQINNTILCLYNSNWNGDINRSHFFLLGIYINKVMAFLKCFYTLLLKVLWYNLKIIHKEINIVNWEKAVPVDFCQLVLVMLAFLGRQR